MAERWDRGMDALRENVREGLPGLRWNLTMIVVVCGVIMTVGLVLMALGS